MDHEELVKYIHRELTEEGEQVEEELIIRMLEIETQFYIEKGYVTPVH